METIIKVYICLKTRSREISIDRGSDHYVVLKIWVEFAILYNSENRQIYITNFKSIPWFEITQSPQYKILSPTVTYKL